MSVKPDKDDAKFNSMWLAVGVGAGTAIGVAIGNVAMGVTMTHSHKRFRLASVRSLICAVMFIFLWGCGDYRSPWHEERLPSGKAIKVTSFNLVWGAEHDDHALGGDCFSLEYVTANPDADPQTRGQEAVEVFELIRPVSELWGFKSAQLAGFPTVDRKGRYDFYIFVRDANGKWSFTSEKRKVFASD